MKTNEVLENIKARRSVRAYTDRQVSEEDLQAILEAATFAPSGMHLETWHFTAIQNADKLAELNERIKGPLAHFTQIYHLYNLLIYNILKRNILPFITEFCIFSPCIIFISNKNSDKSIEILHISPKYITSVDSLMIHIFSSTFNFLYSFTPSDRLESKS